MSILDRPLAQVAEALRRRECSASELVDEALARHHARDEWFGAYKHWDPRGARTGARRADTMLATGHAPPLCGIPVSVKDLYGVEGLPTFAGTARRLPEAWSRDAWLVARLRAQGAVFTGKTHTVELAYGAVGINPHWGTPRNPWDEDTPRIPGGSSAGAGVSLLEGSALVALGSDTGGSIRIPAAMTGTVGHKTTKGRWPTDGVVPLSSTLDTVGALTRTVADSAWFFAAVDPAWGDPAALLAHLDEEAKAGVRVGVPWSALWNDCQPDVAAVLRDALDALEGAGWARSDVDGRLVDDATDLYFTGGIPGAECKAFLERDLPGWMEILHPTVGTRLAPVPPMTSPSYAAAMDERSRMEGAAAGLFREVDVLALPTTLMTPPPVAEMDRLERYVEVNKEALRPTCWVGMLGLCAVTLPVGLDDAGMPVGLQLVGPRDADVAVLGAALAAERVLGTRTP